MSGFDRLGQVNSGQVKYTGKWQPHNETYRPIYAWYCIQVS